MCKGGFDGNGITCTGKSKCSLDVTQGNVNWKLIERHISYESTNVKARSSFVNFPVVSFADVDECSLTGGSGCDPNALCTNTEGSYICRCLRGFEGDGRNCIGKVSTLVWF